MSAHKALSWLGNILRYKELVHVLTCWTIARRCGCLLTLLWIVPICQGEQLPLGSYTSADGLAHDHINRIRRDSKGFLWFCTDEGISRFDGYVFHSYTVGDGLPHPHVNDILEARNGVYWIATGDGVCRYNPRGSRKHQTSRSASEPMFAVYTPEAEERSRVVNTLVEGRDGTIWCGAEDGIYRLEITGSAVRFRAIDAGFVHDRPDASRVSSLLFDSSGVLWAGSGSGLYRRGTDEEWRRFTTWDGLPAHFISALYEDRGGRIWVATNEGGIARLVPVIQSGRRVVDMVYSARNGLPHNNVRAIHESRHGESKEGTLWIGSLDGLTAMTNSDNGKRQAVTYSMAHGLSETRIDALNEDLQGNLWIGTTHGGVMRLARDGLTTYGPADGFRQTGGLNSIVETRSGDLCIVSGDNSERFIQRFDGRRFESIPLRLPASAVGFGWSWYQGAFEDREGAWWLPTRLAPYRFPRVTGVHELSRQTALPVIKPDSRRKSVGRLFEDSRGDVWIASGSDAGHDGGLYRWERSSGLTYSYNGAAEVPLTSTQHPSAFAEDGSGNIWIGFERNAGLLRYRSGSFERFTTADGLPAGSIHALHLDRSKRLWIATSEGGVARIDNPRADRPVFTTYTTADGLSSNEIWCLTEDTYGRIYIGTGRALDRLDPTAAPGAGRFRRYTHADGLAKGNLRAAHRDRHGNLWFVTNLGASRLVPSREQPAPRPPVLITSFRIRGVERPLSDMGESQIEAFELSHDQNQIEIEFAGLDFMAGTPLLYQHKLEGFDAEWSVPAERRSVNYASVPPGRYRLSVRGMNAAGAVSQQPAVVSFTILRPVWRRWWFLMLAAIVVTGGVYAAHRAHLERRLALERVRSRIATDLHDDIGASLSRVAILSEVVKTRISAADGRSMRMLGEIAESARGLVDGMSDIVWSIDPKHDSLAHVIRRLREFASDVLEVKGILWEFDAPPDLDHLRLTPEQRRHLFLILKEAISNAARHADCRSASIRIVLDDNALVAEVRDDGRGFTAADSRGHGLGNMRARAGHLSGTLDIDTGPQQGTRITVRFPLRPRKHKHALAAGNGSAKD